MGTDLDLIYGRVTSVLPLSLRSLGMPDDPDDDDPDEDPDEDPDDEPVSKGKPSEDEVRRLRQESKKRRLALREERKAREKLEAKLRELEDKDKTEVERATTAASEAEKRLAAVEPQLKEAQRKLAFFESGQSAKFQNPAHALRLIDVSDIDDDDPEALAEAIKEKAEALLKESPYLKASAAGGSEGGDEGNGTGSGEGGKPPTTSQGTTSRGRKGAPDPNADLARRFPALAGRTT